MRDHVLVQRVESTEGTFLAQLPADARDDLLADATIHEVSAGQMIFSTADSAERAGTVLRGLARTYLSAIDGRRLTVRYARPGTMIGGLTVDGEALGVQAVVASTILEFDLGTLRRLIAADGRVGLALVAEVARRLEDAHDTLAGNTFGSMRERVARHLLDLATEAPQAGSLVAPVTQQGLADGVGTVREVAARILREFRREGLVATAEGCIEILDPAGIAAIVNRSRSQGWPTRPGQRNDS